MNYEFKVQKLTLICKFTIFSATKYTEINIKILRNGNEITSQGSPMSICRKVSVKAHLYKTNRTLLNLNSYICFICHLKILFFLFILIRLNNSINSSALGFQSLMNPSLKTIKPTTKRSAKIIKSISFNLLLSFSARAIENNLLSRLKVTVLLRQY